MKVTGENWGKSIRELQSECEYCSGKESLSKSDSLWSGRTDSIEISIQGNSMTVDATVDNTDYLASFEIKYCPLCGKRVAH